MSLLGTRRAAEGLSRALDGDAGAHAAGTAPLVALGDRLRGVGAELQAVAGPDEDFRAALRSRLVAVATVQPATAPAARVPRAQKAFGVAAGALASVVAVSGVAVASTQSLPGDPFYGVKRTAEAVQLQLADDGVAEGDRHLQFAAARLDEVRELALGRDAQPVAGQAAAGQAAAGRPAAGQAVAADADWSRVRETLVEMDDSTRRGWALLERAWSDDGDGDALARLSDFAAAQAAELQELLPHMAPEARGVAEASLGLVSQVAATTSELRGLAPCTEACAPAGDAGGADADCDCGPPPSSSPRPSASASPSPSAGPSSPSAPGSPSPSGSARPPSRTEPTEPSGPTEPEPTRAQPSPRPSSGPLAPVPTLPPVPSRLPTPLPTSLPSDSSTPAPPVPPQLHFTPPALPAVPSVDPEPDVLPG